MAKTHGPLLSVNASGTVAKINTYSHRKTGNQCRYQRKQKDSNTFNQGKMRYIVTILHYLWTTLSAAQKATFKDIFPGTIIPAYNSFIKLNYENCVNKKKIIKSYPSTSFDTYIYDVTPALSGGVNNYSVSISKYSVVQLSAAKNTLYLLNNITGAIVYSFTNPVANSDIYGYNIGNGTIYLLRYATTNNISIMRLDNGAHIKTISSPVSGNLIICPILLDNRLYFATGENSAGLQYVDQKTLANGGNTVAPGSVATGRVIAYDETYIYLLRSAATYSVTRFKRTDLTDKATVNVANATAQVYRFCIGKQFIYCSQVSSPGRIHRINKATFTYVDYLDLPSGQNNPYFMFERDDTLFVQIGTAANSITKIDVNSFTYVSNAAIPGNRGYNIMDVIDFSFVLFQSNASSMRQMLYVP